MTLVGLALITAAAVGAVVVSSCERTGHEALGIATQPLDPTGDPVVDDAAAAIAHGRQIFRFDTFGDEDFWGGQLHLHEAIEGAANGGIGPGLSPVAALALGLKVDVDALPPWVLAAVQGGQINLNDPAVTLALLKLNAVVGLTGFFSGCGELESVGVQCALCHSTVDDPFAAGVGSRLDGWPNRDLDVGAIIALAPDLSPYSMLLGVDENTVRQVLLSWGPGRFDAELILDGKAFRPDGEDGGDLAPGGVRPRGRQPPHVHGLGLGPLLERLRGQPRDARQRHVLRSAPRRSGEVPDRGGQWLLQRQDPARPHHVEAPDLHLYQLALRAPAPPAGSFDPAAIFAGRAAVQRRSGLREVPCPTAVHRARLEPAHARGDRHRRLPGGAIAHQSLPDDAAQRPVHPREGGFYHDGRFPTLLDVVEHYNIVFGLGLTSAQESDLVEYLKSL